METKNDKKSEAEAALGGTNVTPGSNATPQDAPALEALEAPPGFEGENAPAGAGMNTEPKRYVCQLATREEISSTLGRNWAQVTRINNAKALVRISVFDKVHGGKKDELELVGVATVRYAVSQDGRVTGPFGFRNDEWPQMQYSHNTVLSRLEAVAVKDQDGGQYFRELCQRANVSPFPPSQGAGGSYITLAGVFDQDIRAFCNKHNAWIARRILSLAPPARRTPATTAVPPTPAQAG